MNGLCLTSSILYQTTIKCSNSKYKQKRYKGICETTFKKRYANHKKSFNLINSKNDTTLSVEYWTLKQKQQVPRLTWEIKGQYKAYNPTLKKCNPCLNEKLAIIDDPDKNLLNKRSEVISQCRHRNKFKLVNLTLRKTLNDVIWYVIPFYCIAPLRYSVIISRLKIVAWVTKFHSSQFASGSTSFKLTSKYNNYDRYAKYWWYQNIFFKFDWLQTLCTLEIMKLLENISKIK